MPHALVCLRPPATLQRVQRAVTSQRVQRAATSRRVGRAATRSEGAETTRGWGNFEDSGPGADLRCAPARRRLREGTGANKGVGDIGGGAFSRLAPHVVSPIPARSHDFAQLTAS